MSDSPGVVSKRIHFTESEKFSTKLCEWGVLYANHKVTKLPRFLLPQKFSTQRRYWAWNIKDFIKSINNMCMLTTFYFTRGLTIPLQSLKLLPFNEVTVRFLPILLWHFYPNVKLFSNIFLWCKFYLHLEFNECSDILIIITYRIPQILPVLGRCSDWCKIKYNLNADHTTNTFTEHWHSSKLNIFWSCSLFKQQYKE